MVAVQVRYYNELIWLETEFYPILQCESEA